MIPGMTSDKIKFPISYTLKVIMESSPGDEKNIQFITDVLKRTQVPFSEWNKKKSAEGKYTSYSVNVTLNSLITLRLMYSELKKNEAVKFTL